MSVFCVDIGNTRTHFALVSGDRAVSAEGHLDTAEAAAAADEGGVAAVWSNLQAAGSRPTGVALCSVVPPASAELLPRLRAAGADVFQLGWEDCPGLEINYPNPAEIGQDRLANSIAAQTLAGVPAVVIDMGTAVTFDIVTARGYEGGIIAPGLEVMTRYLHEQTALLPALDPADLMVSAGFGKTTVEAMKLGCSVGFEGMIRALLGRVREGLAGAGHPEPKVLATGGSAGALPQTWLRDFEFHPHLTLIGLAEAYGRRAR